MKPTRILSAVLLALIVGGTLVQEAAGVPAFARRHKFSCTTCHAPFPRLKDFGDEFAGDGFMIPEEEKERDYVTAGDELLWLNRTFQLGMRLDAWMMLEEGDVEAGETVDSDLQIPWGVKVFSGGAITKSIGYYFYFYLSEHGEVAGIEDAYVHFNDVAGLPLDLMVGQFQTSDPLMKRELRLSHEDYRIYKERVGQSRINLAYDRGIMAVTGIEATGTDLVGFIVNGNGIGEAAGGSYDGDRYKNYGFRVNQGIGDFASVGAYLYQGLENLPLFGGGPGDWRQNEVRYFGPDLSLGVGPLSFTAQYLTRWDSNPEGMDTAPEDDVETKGAIAELVYLPGGDDGRHAFVLLYNQAETDPGDGDCETLYETLAVGSSYLLARNFRIHAEYRRDLHNEMNRGLLGFTAGF